MTQNPFPSPKKSLLAYIYILTYSYLLAEVELRGRHLELQMLATDVEKNKGGIGDGNLGDRHVL